MFMAQSVKRIAELFQLFRHIVKRHIGSPANPCLLMNWLQFEFGLIPLRIFSDDKEEYIKALVATRESEDLGIFRQFMTDTMLSTFSAHC